MIIRNILKISIIILFAFVFTDIAMSSCCNPPVIISPSDNEVFIAGKTYTDICQATGDPVITWSGPGSFSPTTGSPVSWTAPSTTGSVTITATNSCGSDQVEVKVVNVIFVDEDANGNDDGTSWTDAFNYLQDALDAASSGVEIWIAEGTYYPDEGNSVTDDDRTETFQLVSNVGVYGGFDPTIGDDLWAERDYINNVTILSGDIDDDGVLDDENSYHIVKGADNATIDGFTITGGYANGAGSNMYGAGMYNFYVSPTVKNCSFISNAAIYGSHYYTTGGGGICNCSSNPIITGCIFYNNTVAKVCPPNPGYLGFGGAILNTVGSAPTITNCVFSTNYANNDGGAIANYDSNPTIENCVFVLNDARLYGGGIMNEDSETIITNSTFTGNSATTGGGMFNLFSDITVTNCIFWDDIAENYDNEIHTTSCTITVTYSDVEGGHAGTGNIDADPKFFDINDFDGPDDLFMTTDDGLEIDYDSPCIDKGNNTPVTEPYDITGRTRIIDGDEDGTATVDMGAYEYDPS